MGDAGSIEEQVAELRKQIPGFDDFCSSVHEADDPRLKKATTKDLLGDEGDGPRSTVRTGLTKSLSQHERDGHDDANEEEVSDDNEVSMFDKEQEEEEDSDDDSDASEVDKKKRKKKKGISSDDN